MVVLILLWLRLLLVEVMRLRRRLVRLLLVLPLLVVHVIERRPVVARLAAPVAEGLAQRTADCLAAHRHDEPLQVLVAAARPVAHARRL